MKRIYSFFLALMACMSMQAQYVVSDKYDLWFEDTGHEVTARKSVDCTDNYQDLWNGCYVKTSGRTVYIYRGGSSILYGDEINLLYNGYYRVRRGNTWYLADEDGDLVSGIYGKAIYYFPFGYVTFQRDAGYWDIYHCSGRKVDCYSDCSGTAVSSSSKENTGMPWTAMATNSMASMATKSPSLTTARGNVPAART